MSSRTEVPPIEIDHERYVVVAKSHVGCVRDENQDFMGCFQSETRMFLIVVDGMGGHSGGFEASRIAVKIMGEFFAENSAMEPQKILYDSIDQAHKIIHQRSVNEPQLKGMGTTVVAMLLDREQLWLAHVGDSRAHLYRQQKLFQLTLDHSCVNSLALMGDIPLHQIDDHHLGHILERSLGGKEMVEIEVRPEPIKVQKGDRFLLSTDGFWQLSDDDAIEACLAEEDLNNGAERALQHAIDAGGSDNITVGFLDIQIGESIDHTPEDVRVAFRRNVENIQKEREQKRSDRLALPPPPEPPSK